MDFLPSPFYRNTSPRYDHAPKIYRRNVCCQLNLHQIVGGLQTLPRTKGFGAAVPQTAAKFSGDHMTITKMGGGYIQAVYSYRAVDRETGQVYSATERVFAADQEELARRIKIRFPNIGARK